MTRFSIAFLLSCFPYAAMGFVRVTGQDVSTVMETWHKMSNMEFYGVMILWPSTFFMLGKLRQGEKLRPFLSKTVAWTLWMVNGTCLILMAVHFMPEMSSVLEFIINTIKRVFA